MKCVDGALVK